MSANPQNPNPQTPDNPPADPTPAQASSVAAAAAAAAAQPGQNPEQAEQAAAAATRREAQAQNIKLSDEDVQRIAQTTIHMLEQAGAFDPPPAPAQPAPGSGGESSAATQPPARRSAAEEVVCRVVPGQMTTEFLTALEAVLDDPERLRLPDSQLRELTRLATDWANRRNPQTAPVAGYRVGCAEGLVAGVIAGLHAQRELFQRLALTVPPTDRHEL